MIHKTQELLLVTHLYYVNGDVQVNEMNPFSRLRTRFKIKGPEYKRKEKKSIAFL